MVGVEMKIIFLEGYLPITLKMKTYTLDTAILPLEKFPISQYANRQEKGYSLKPCTNCVTLNKLSKCCLTFL